MIAKKIVIRNRTTQPLCHNCLRLTVGTEEENKKLIEIHIDTDKRLDIKEKYSVGTLPKYFIINKNEIKKNEGIGYRNAKDFIKWLGE